MLFFISIQIQTYSPQCSYINLWLDHKIRSEEEPDFDNYLQGIKLMYYLYEYFLAVDCPVITPFIMNLLSQATFVNTS